VRARQRPRDTGASAVEFAILAPLLFLILFGIIQFGYGLFQIQAFNATVDEASRIASTGVTNCGAFDTQVQNLAGANGLTPGDVGSMRLDWLNADLSIPSPPLPARGGYVRITATFQPFDIGVPFVPFPDTVVGTSDSKIQDIGLSSLPGCL
jgi:hypothetical protein